MGQNPRSLKDRRHKHSDSRSPVMIWTEGDLDKLLQKGAPAPFVLILDGILDPHNFGACLRSAEAAGVTFVVIPKDRAVGITAVVRQTACGAAETIPILQATNLARIMERLKEAGVWIVGTDDKATKSLYDLDLKGPMALVVGAEGEGMRRLTTDKCDFVAHIPMIGKMDCLNASVATGVCLFEIVRQRLAVKKG
jgi:23S rRNA (guanosine2251-2'-O)-methyltransferase